MTCGRMLPRRFEFEGASECQLPDGHAGLHRSPVKGKLIDWEWANCGCENCLADDPEDACVDYREADVNVRRGTGQ